MELGVSSPPVDTLASLATALTLATMTETKVKGRLHFLHSVSAATSLSTSVTSLNLFLWVSRTISGSPPLSVRNRSKSSTIFPRCLSERAWMRSQRWRLKPGCQVLLVKSLNRIHNLICDLITTNHLLVFKNGLKRHLIDFIQML